MTRQQLACEGGTATRDTMLVFGSPDIGQEEIDEVIDSIRSGWIGTGPKVAKFESMFRDYVGASHAVAVNSCTAALHLSMLTVGLSDGDEVITTPMTFCATANAIIHAGGTPVFVDVRSDTMNIDAERIEAAITPRTRAILPVHFAGRPCDMPVIMEIARKHDLLVIEDAAHCIEGTVGSRKIGSIGDLTCFSFYVTKNLVTGEGGMVTTNREDWADRIKIKALHGMSRDAWRRFSDEGFRHYEVTEPGFKYNMMDIQAAFGIHQLKRIEQNYRRRETVWRQYNEAFADLPVTLPAPPEPATTHALHLYTVLLHLEDLTASRDRVLDAIQRENVGVGVHYISLHQQAYYRTRFEFGRDDFPNAAYISDRTISLPLSSKLTDQDVDDVITAVRKVIRAYAR